jgi:hypothetical protein
LEKTHSGAPITQSMAPLQMNMLNSVAEFLAKAAPRYFAEERGRWIFRGHSDAQFRLIPAVGRGAHTAKTRAKYERSLFDIFCREA